MSSLVLDHSHAEPREYIVFIQVKDQLNQFFVWNPGIDYRWDFSKVLALGPFLQFNIENWHEGEYLLFYYHSVRAFMIMIQAKGSFLDWQSMALQCILILLRAGFSIICFVAWLKQFCIFSKSLNMLKIKLLSASLSFGIQEEFYLLKMDWTLRILVFFGWFKNVVQWPRLTI